MDLNPGLCIRGVFSLYCSATIVKVLVCVLVFVFVFVFVQGAYQFSEINLRPFLRRFKTRLFWNLRPVCTMNDKQGLGNEASAATHEIR